MNELLDFRVGVFPADVTFIYNPGRPCDWQLVGRAGQGFDLDRHIFRPAGFEPLLDRSCRLEPRASIRRSNKHDLRLLGACKQLPFHGRGSGEEFWLAAEAEHLPLVEDEQPAWRREPAGQVTPPTPHFHRLP